MSTKILDKRYQPRKILAKISPTKMSVVSLKNMNVLIAMFTHYTLLALFHDKLLQNSFYLGVDISI